MKIIDDLARGAIEKNRKNSLATRITIGLAILVLGTVIFILASFRQERYDRIKSQGDYQVTLYPRGPEDLKKLEGNSNIGRLDFDKIYDSGDALLIESGPYFWEGRPLNLAKGREPKNEAEVLLPQGYLTKRKDLKLGGPVDFGGRKRKIVGVYDDYGLGLEDPLLYSKLTDKDSSSLFEGEGLLSAHIRYKSPRDTYPLTEKLLEGFGLSLEKAKKLGFAQVNKELLEFKFIYPSGLLPPKEVVKRTLSTYRVSLLLVVLFATMIYGAFSTWNRRDMREIALLKSVGMTERQVKAFVRKKSQKLATLPFILGLVFSYFFANLIYYLIWKNNAISYKNLSDILGERMVVKNFTPIRLSPSPIILIILLGLLTIFLSSERPARESAKVPVIEGLRGSGDLENLRGRSKIRGEVTKTLACDYYRAYRKTYGVIIFSTLISAGILCLSLISSAYDGVNEAYDTYQSPYNFSASIFNQEGADEEFIENIKNLPGADQVHVYRTASLPLSFEENKKYFSKDLLASFEDGRRDISENQVELVGLEDKDFEALPGSENGDFLLLNKSPRDGTTPFAFRDYVEVLGKNEGELILNSNGEKTIKISGLIGNFPFDLEENRPDTIYLFTGRKKLEELQPEGEKSLELKILVKKNKEEVFSQAKRELLASFSENDFSVSNDIQKKAGRQEEKRNVRTLNGGLQILLIILALSNSYNSFHSNLRSRKSDFLILSSLGMTEGQIKKMLRKESFILLKKTILSYALIFFLAVLVRAKRSKYTLSFVCPEILKRVSYLPMIIIFVIIALGVLLAINSAIKEIMGEDKNEALMDRF